MFNKATLQIIPADLLDDYLRVVGKESLAAFYKLEDAELSTTDFSFYTSVASVFSSRIEGEDIELDSYIKYKRDGITFLPDYTRKTDDLYDAYTFARNNPLNAGNIAVAHRILSRHLLAGHHQGKLRTNNMYVSTPDGKIEYVAALPAMVPGEMEKFYADLALLLAADMGIREVFFFVSLIHLVFVKIHPFNDGNGRTARLLEKWFLAEKLGSKAWFLQSEKNYYLQHQLYYNNLRKPGLEYHELDYSKAMDFLLMLAKTLTISA